MKTTSIVVTKQPLIPSPWGSRDGTRVHPKLLSVQFGDGKQAALISFYHCPELVLLVRYDSSLPLDLPDRERFKPYEGIRSFRDLVPQIEEIASETIKAPRSWNSILKDGSTWTLA